MKLRLYDGTNYFVYTTIIEIMSREIWKNIVTTLDEVWIK